MVSMYLKITCLCASGLESTLLYYCFKNQGCSFLGAKAITQVIRMLKTDVNKGNETAVRDEAAWVRFSSKKPQLVANDRTAGLMPEAWGYCAMPRCSSDSNELDREALPNA